MGRAKVPSIKQGSGQEFQAEAQVPCSIGAGQIAAGSVPPPSRCAGDFVGMPDAEELSDLDTSGWEVFAAGSAGLLRAGLGKPLLRPAAIAAPSSSMRFDAVSFLPEQTSSRPEQAAMGPKATHGQGALGQERTTSPGSDKNHLALLAVPQVIGGVSLPRRLDSPL